MDQTATQNKIRKQVDFYFSDSNLPFDKFLYTLSQKNDGWIPIKTLADFKKMKMITEDLDTVVAALKAEPSEIIEVNEKQELRRKTPIQKQDISGRSIYAKSFSVEKETEDKTGDLLNLQDEIQEYFEQFGKVLSVRMRRKDGRNGGFKGSVFVEFSTPEEAKKVAGMDLEYKGTKLELLTKQEYVDKKAELYKDAPSKPKKYSFNAFALQNEPKANNKKRTHDSEKDSDDKRQKTEE